jgi:hypothetical protein
MGFKRCLLTDANDNKSDKKILIPHFGKPCFVKGQAGSVKKKTIVA